RYQTFDVALDAVSRRNEQVGVTGSMELRHIGLCEALIFADKLRRERHVNDPALAHMVFERRRRLSFGAPAGVDDRGCDLIEARWPARTDVENARAVTVVEKIEIHLCDVFDRDEIALLLSRRITTGAFEQLHAA